MFNLSATVVLLLYLQQHILTRATGSEPLIMTTSKQANTLHIFCEACVQMQVRPIHKYTYQELY